MAQERTLALIKPDVHGAGHSLTIESIYLRAGLTISAIRQFNPSKVDTLPLVQEHYREHEGRPYYDDLVSFMTSGAITALVITGDNAIERVRRLNGATDPAKAGEGTIRARFGTAGPRNAVHGSDSQESAEREIAIWFPHLRPKDKPKGSP
jgi:nucleoside-diphosphate kinase